MHGHHLQNLILEGCSQEKVNNLRLLDGQREKVDVLQGLDLHVLDEEAQLGNREPLLVLGLASTNSVASDPAPTPAGTPAPDALPKPPRKPTRPPIAGAPGPPGPPAGLASSTIWCFNEEEAKYNL